MSDLISRQAAIEAVTCGALSSATIFGRSDAGMVALRETVRVIKELPSVQPTGELISKQDAIDAVKKNTFRLTFAEEQNCEGRVAWSAEAVYSDVMEGALLEMPSAQPEPEFEWCHDCKEYDLSEHCCHRWTKVIRNTVEELKQSALERKTGRWEYLDYGGFGNWHCTSCGKIAIVNGNEDYCPNCGAKMEVEDDSYKATT